MTDYRWADETRAHGMAHPERLKRAGWVEVRRHPRYPSSVLMKRAVKST